MHTQLSVLDQASMLILRTVTCLAQALSEPILTSYYGGLAVRTTQLQTNVSV